MITVFAVGVIAVLDLVGIFAAVLLLGIGVLVIGEIRNGVREAR